MDEILSPTDFVLNGVFSCRALSGRCYQLVESAGTHSRAARQGLYASKRVSLAYYNACLAACRRHVEGGAA
jgi:hypothetical protein